jgi:hypothetical protein
LRWPIADEFAAITPRRAAGFLYGVQNAKSTAAAVLLAERRDRLLFLTK